MDNLPSDILRDIFHESVVDVPDSDTYFNFRSFAAPLWISHVSRRWREESLAFGKLWSYVDIEFNCNVTTQSRGLKYIFDTCLQRTNGSPLYFKIHCLLGGTWDHDPEAPNVAEHMLTNMLAQQHRWRRVDLQWVWFNPSPNFQGFHATNMPMLLSLKLGGTFWKDREGEVFANVSIAQSRQLEELKLSGDYLLHVGEEPILTLKGPCSFVSCYQTQPCANSCLELLKISPNLEWLDIRLVVYRGPFDKGAQDARNLVSERLRILRLEARSAPFIIRMLTLPSLNVLRYNDHLGLSGGEALLNFVQRSAPPLTRLEVGGNAMSKISLIPILRLLPMLEELRINTTEPPFWLFEALTLRDTVPSGRTVSPAGNIICPRLASFRLQGLIPEEDNIFYLVAFCAMLESRRKVLGTFGTIWLDDDGHEKLDVPLTSYEDYLKLREGFCMKWAVWAGGRDAVGPNPLSDRQCHGVRRNVGSG